MIGLAYQLGKALDDEEHLQKLEKEALRIRLDAIEQRLNALEQPKVRDMVFGPYGTGVDFSAATR